MGEEESVKKILLFGNPDQEEVELKKKFVEELCKERSRKFVKLEWRGGALSEEKLK